MDFVSDQLAQGRRFRTLNIVDDFSRECLAITAAFSMPAMNVASILSTLLKSRGKPNSIVVDNGPEFTSRVLNQWAYENEIQLDFIHPRKPSGNAFIESFNGEFRDECLNMSWFKNMTQASLLNP